jgi:hypothetical protein
MRNEEVNSTLGKISGEALKLPVYPHAVVWAS